MKRSSNAARFKTNKQLFVKCFAWKVCLCFLYSLSFLCNNIQVFISNIRHQYTALLSVNMECVFILLRFSFFLNLFFFLLCSFSSSDTTSGGSWWCPSWGGEGSPVRYRPGNFVGLISSELGVRATPPGCSALLCSTGLLLGGRKHSVISAPPCYWLLAARCPGIGCSLWWRITSPCHLNKGNQQFQILIL